MLHFAVAGVPTSTPNPGGTVEGLKEARRLEIDAMEMEWVQRVPVNPERMFEIRKTAQDGDMYLTVHAPYYVNLNAKEPEKLTASIKRVLDALTMAELAGAHSVCVHAAFYLGGAPEIAMSAVKKAVENIMQHKKTYFPHVNLGLETMGKQTQFGTLEEVLEVSKEFGIYPTLDPAHLHARTNGKLNTEAECEEMLDIYASYLGTESLKSMHMHFSGIAYGLKGEKHHLPLQESDANWQGFLRVLKRRNIGGVVVCESPLLEQDTILMKETYGRI